MPDNNLNELPKRRDELARQMRDAGAKALGELVCDRLTEEGYPRPEQLHLEYDHSCGPHNGLIVRIAVDGDTGSRAAMLFNKKRLFDETDACVTLTRAELDLYGYEGVSGSITKLPLPDTT